MIVKIVYFYVCINFPNNMTSCRQVIRKVAFLMKASCLSHSAWLFAMHRIMQNSSN
jgi:hypothetical protein